MAQAVVGDGLRRRLSGEVFGLYWILGLALHSGIALAKEASAMSSAPISEQSVVQFLHRFEALASQQDFSKIEVLVHERAYFRFNDGDFIGRAAVRQAFEKPWQSGYKVENERFYLSDIVVLSTDQASASATYGYHWEGQHEGRQFRIQGRGSRVLVRGPDGGLQIIHEHLSRLPKVAEPGTP